MALTERGGGSDVRSGTRTTATPAGDGSWLVNGAKWFVSAAQSDAFFVLAQTGDGLSLLLVPRLTDAGALNGLRFDRLKDKLGNRSNPTAEVEISDASGVLVGEEGRGVRAIMEMIGGTRHDCVLGSAAVMRLGTARGDPLGAPSPRVRPRPRRSAARCARCSPTSRSSPRRRPPAPCAWRVPTRPRTTATRRRRSCAGIAAPVLKYWTLQARAAACRRGARVPGRVRVHRGVRGSPAPTARRR